MKEFNETGYFTDKKGFNNRPPEQVPDAIEPKPEPLEEKIVKPKLKPKLRKIRKV